MSLEAFDIAPTASDFTALSEHQEQTPNTFFASKPVLHLHCPLAKLKFAHVQAQNQPAIKALQATAPNNATQTNGADPADILIHGTDVWVTSKHLILWSTNTSKGVRVPYPTITITAQDGDAVLLELNFTDQNSNDDEDIEFMQMRIFPDTVVHDPASTSSTETNPPTQQTNGDGSSGPAPAVALWQAIFDCQELNPDPQTQEDDEDAFDETAPGATGWITADNMQDFMDEDGNLKIPDDGTVVYGEEGGGAGNNEAGSTVLDGESASGELGAGAGRTRTAAEVEAADGGDDEESKWRRTD
ncbi:hypothetical protein K431DRAFT_252252 [Polychaeton citri CBS 116435]|uniref:Uncharacterized protein n=1 Tax=Polychaeton citri CBS 116435 TaxID=1314669 RepID=A0A9P4Q1T1_9PEZI|nr:hypothetical protein K431DRAFT_252252 [Polychaeton citri CBS 116435]